MTTVIGYTCVSRRDPASNTHETELLAAGATRVFIDRDETDRISARPQWVACLHHLGEGDTLLLQRLDRLGRSERIVIRTLDDLRSRGIHIRSLTEPQIDTTTPTGGVLFQIVEALSALRRDAISENTRRGMEYARTQGRTIGRPSKLVGDQRDHLQRLRDEDGLSFTRIGEILGVDRSTASRVYRALRDGQG
ncbi:recombinase family protein [uncultured Microbacterium sp.]|uniref:recombinase family protein n=1 Tax=uncultured Microbacterium sp. TaxID=191216 RepID=UPI0025F4AA33|nr:recombinase family protein [uncultured Microbacterium sp.]